MHLPTNWAAFCVHLIRVWVWVSLSFSSLLHVCCCPNTSFPMLPALNRRVPRTKSVFDRTSSRRYSSVDYDSNGFDDHPSDSYLNGTYHRHNSVSNNLKLLDSILHQQQQHGDDDVDDEEEAFGTTNNGHDRLTVSLGDNDDDDDDDDDDHDEYACFLHHRFLSLPWFTPSLVSSLWQTFLDDFSRFIVGGKTELRVRRPIGRVCDEVPLTTFKLCREKNQKCKSFSSIVRRCLARTIVDFD